MELPKKTVNKGEFTPGELEFIQQNAQKMTDRQIGEILNRAPMGIVQQRQKLGITKKNGRPSKKDRYGNKAPEEQEKVAKAIDALGDMEKTLSKQDKQKLAERLFRKSADYERFGKQLTDEEMEKFTRMFAEYLAEWEKILPQEKEQLNNALKEVIIQDRTLAQIKQNEFINEELTKLEGEMLELVKKVNKSDADKDRIKEIKEYVRETRSALVQPIVLMKIYDESVDRQQDIIKQLGMSRQDRLKRDADRGLTLVSIVQALAEKDIRKKAGDECASIISDIEKKKIEMGKKGILSGEI